MLWLVDLTSPTPLFEQVAATVRGAISSGEVVKGDRLPAARDVAESLDINIHTVLKAYQMLRDEGLIELRRGRGAIIAAEQSADAELLILAKELLSRALHHGIDAAEVGRRISQGEWA
ncbi:MAG: GntR family transcriptional regulator [Propionibacteriaceae bacterium]